MTLKEVASGNQYLRALLAGKRDGYCGELNAKTRGADRAPLSSWWRGCPMVGWGQPWLGGWQCWAVSHPVPVSGGCCVCGAAEQGNRAGPQCSCFSIAPLQWWGAHQPFSSGWCSGTLHWAPLVTLQTRGAWLLLRGPEAGAAGGDWEEMGGPGKVPGTPVGSGWFWGMRKEQPGKKHNKGSWWADRKALGQGPLGKFSPNHGDLRPYRGRCMW